jgi:hypothetical protein
MRTKRNQRGVRRARVPLALSVRKAVTQHVRKHLVAYVPALLPLAFFFLAHLLTVLTLIFIKSGLLRQEHLLHKTVVTWAVYGFLPLLLCSYLCFFVVARPVTGILERKFPHWTATMLNLSSGGAYGAAMGLFLLLLLEPRTWLNAVFLLFIGMVVGQGNWFFYRKLTADAA